MRRYGSSRRNPNPSWPGVQTGVVLPPDLTREIINKNENYEENNNVNARITVKDTETETIHERDGFTPIMSYMTESEGMYVPYNTNRMEGACKNISITEYLCDKSGNYARIEFLFGENTHVEKTGMLESVGKDYVVLLEAGTGSRIVCLTKNIKFINIYNVK